MNSELVSQNMRKTPEASNYKKAENNTDLKIANSMVQLGKINISCSNEKEDCKSKHYFNSDENLDESVKLGTSEQNCYNNTDEKTYKYLQQPTFSIFTTENVQDTRFVCPINKKTAFFFKLFKNL